MIIPLAGEDRSSFNSSNSATVLYQNIFSCQILLYFLNIGSFFVYFIKGNDKRNFFFFDNSDGFFGLGLYAFVGGNNQNSNVGHFCSAGAYGRKCLVSRCVQKCNHFWP